MNTDEMCEYLGISESTLYKYTSKGKIPHFKPMGKVYFSRKEIDEWIKSSRVKEIEDVKYYELNTDNNE